MNYHYRVHKYNCQKTLAYLQVSDAMSDGGRDGNNYWWDDEPLTRNLQVTSHLNSVFAILQNPHRRYLLYYLYSVEEAVVPVGDLVEAIQQYESAGTDPDKTPATQSVRLGLLNIHLPKLASEEIIDYDPEREKVRFWGYKPLDEWVYHARHLEFD